MIMTEIKDSRDSILSRIKNNRPASHQRPEIPEFKVPGKALQNFVSHVKGFDGDTKLFHSREEAVDWLRKLVESTKGVVFSVVDGVRGGVGTDNFDKPSEMNTIDVCIAEGIMTIGETGSVVVDTKSLGSPAAALFSTDLYLLVDRSTLVESVQQAYMSLDLGSMQYSSFFTGPSATADIEAVHITGAQGEISLTVVMYGCSDADIADAEAILARLPEGTPLGQPDAPRLSLKRETIVEKGQDSV